MEALLPTCPMYVEEGGRLNLAKDGEEEMRCKLWRIRLGPLSLGARSKGRGPPLLVLFGVIAPGESVISSQST